MELALLLLKDIFFVHNQPNRLIPAEPCLILRLGQSAHFSASLSTLYFQPTCVGGTS